MTARKEGNAELCMLVYGPRKIVEYIYATTITTTTPKKVRIEGRKEKENTLKERRWRGLRKEKKRVGTELKLT